LSQSPRGKAKGSPFQGGKLHAGLRGGGGEGKNQDARLKKDQKEGRKLIIVSTHRLSYRKDWKKSVPKIKMEGKTKNGRGEEDANMGEKGGVKEFSIDKKKRGQQRRMKRKYRRLEVMVAERYNRVLMSE